LVSLNVQTTWSATTELHKTKNAKTPPINPCINDLFVVCHILHQNALTAVDR
jgi:hypothetical protein